LGTNFFDIPSFFRHGIPISGNNLNNLILPLQIPEPFIFKNGVGNLGTVGVIMPNGDFKFLEPDKSVYRFIKNSAFPEDLSYPYLERSDSFILVSYPMDHYVYKYELESFAFLGSEPFCPQNHIQFPDPLSRNDFEDRNLKWKYRISTPFYEPVRYHSRAGLYSRILHYPLQIENKNLTYEMDQRRLSSIIVYDLDFKFIDEIKIDSGQIGIYQSISTPDGYLFGPCSSLYSNEKNIILNNRLNLTIVN
jgi:hypothetical protein